MRTAIRQGDLDDDAWPITWAAVLDSVQQMPKDVPAHYGDPQALTAALERVVHLEGAHTEVFDTYQREASDLLP